MATIPIRLDSFYPPCPGVATVTISARGPNIFFDRTVTLGELQRGEVVVPVATTLVSARPNGQEALSTRVPAGTRAIALVWTHFPDIFGDDICEWAGPVTFSLATPPQEKTSDQSSSRGRKCRLTAWERVVLDTYHIKY